MIAFWLIISTLLLAGADAAAPGGLALALAAAAARPSLVAVATAAVQLPPPPRRSTCRGCDRPTRVCICDSLPPGPIRTLSTRLLVLRHPAEARRKHTGTATLLPLCVSKCDIVGGTHFLPEDLPPLREAGRADIRPLLLFPGPSARPLHALREGSGDAASGNCDETNDGNESGNSVGSVDRTEALLIAIDGTWRQAYHMLRHSPDLVAACDVVYLPPDDDDNSRRSEFDPLRREPAPHCTSTAEAVAEALCRIERTDAAAGAAEYIRSGVRAMVGRQLEYSGVAPVRVEGQKQRSLRRSLSLPTETTEILHPEVVQDMANDAKSQDDSEVDGTVLYRRVEPVRVPLINSFYKLQRYRAVAKRSDTVWEARNAYDVTLLAAVRLVPKRCAELGTVHFLRNLFVSEACRRRGIGTNLVRAALETERESMPCYYCYTDKELVSLYLAAGLEVLDASTVPAWMREEYSQVSRQQSGTLVLLGRNVCIDGQTPQR